MSPMSLRALPVYCLPEDTARVARAAFPKGNAYLRIFDALGPISANPQFADLFPTAGQPTVSPAQLALATIFEFAEGLSDRMRRKPDSAWWERSYSGNVASLPAA
jgi:hypothetical protein